MTGKIFAIEEFATFDGPGIRMNVFMKGCPLRCEWCHNPEGQSCGVEYKRSPNGCKACGACLRAGEGRLTEKSVAACPNRLVRRCDEDISVEKLCEKVEKNAAILLASGGGVTFSGGEPLMQGDFVRACMIRLQKKVSCALQTSGYADEKTFKAVLDVCDYVLYDLKLFDPVLHEKYCGKDNAPILANYRTLVSSGKSFVTRIPLIPGVTDTETNSASLADFMNSLGVDTVELLPYNKFTGSKYASLLRKYEPSFDDKKEPSRRIDIFEKRGIRAVIL